MNKYINISKNVIKKRPKDITLKLDSAFIYMPVEETSKILFNPGKVLKKETIIAMNSDNIPLITPVSGVFLGIKEMPNYQNKNIKTLVIKNNYKEETGKKIASKRNLSKYSKEVVLLIMQRLNLKTNKDKNLFREIDREPHKVYVNALCDEPNNYNNEFRLLHNKDLILETISALNTIFDLGDTHLLIKDTCTEVIDVYKEYLGSFPNINLRLIKDVYPVSRYEVLQNYLKLDPKDLVIGLEDIYRLGYALKRQRFVTEKLLTVSGPVVIDPQIYELKIGTKLSEILDIKDIKSKYDIWINNYLEQNKLELDDLVIDNNVEALIITEKNKLKVKPCNNCGICYNSCPANIDPKRLNEEEVYKKCLKCGLCSYMCPCNILIHKKEVKVNE